MVTRARAVSPPNMVGPMCGSSRSGKAIGDPGRDTGWLTCVAADKGAIDCARSARTLIGILCSSTRALDGYPASMTDESDHHRQYAAELERIGISEEASRYFGVGGSFADAIEELRA